MQLLRLNGKFDPFFFFLISFQGFPTVNTAAFWSWSVSSSGSSPSRSSLQSIMAAGLAGKLWRSVLASGSRKLKLSCNLCLSFITAKTKHSSTWQYCVKHTVANKWQKHSTLHILLLLLRLLTLVCSVHFATIAFHCIALQGMWWSRWTWNGPLIIHVDEKIETVEYKGPFNAYWTKINVSLKN